VNIRFNPSKINSICSMLLISLTAVTSTHCGSSKSSERPLSQSQRTGRANSSVAAKYIDESPTVSKDGTKVLFTSGRDGGTSRIYKTTWAGTAWSSPQRLSASSGMTSENLAKISPDGNYALVQGVADSGEVLSLCDVAAETCSSIASSPWGNGEFEFSPDSVLLFYLKGDKSSGANLHIAARATASTSYQIGTSDTWAKVLWLNSTLPDYSIVAAKKATTVGKMTLTKRTFTSAANSASATESTLGPDISYGSQLDPGSASAARFSVTLPLKPSVSKVFGELGDYVGTDSDKKKSIPLTDEVHTWLANGTDEGSIAASPGFESHFAWITADDTTLFTLNRLSVRCAGDLASTYGYSVALVNRADNAITWRHLKKPTDLSQGPVVTQNPCDKTLNGTATTMDFAASDLRVNRDATATAHTLTWSSDMTGDPEIFASITAAGVTTVYNISGNRVP
jgi:hypothetical protein